MSDIEKIIKTTQTYNKKIYKSTPVYICNFKYDKKI